MATLIKFTVKDVPVEFDLEKLTPEVQIKMLTKGCARSFFERETGKGDKSSLETIQAAAQKVSTDPNSYYLAVGHRGEGVSRPKLDMYERKAKSWLTAEFFPAVKLGVEAAVKLWNKAGGSGVLLTAKEDATEAIKAAVLGNVTARDKLLAAKAKKLKDTGWEPELI